MTLTVVTAVFNAIKSGNRENLIRCVRSVAAIKTPHEHLIYDGASTDGTVELLRELEKEVNNSTTSHSSLLTIRSEPDTGIYNALNKGVRDAQGEWFYVLGCDDYICHPEVMDRILADVGGEEMIVTEVAEDNDEGNTRKIHLSALLWSMPYCHQGVLMKTNVVRRLSGFDEQYKIAADFKILLQCHILGCKVKHLFGDGGIFACFGAMGMSDNNIDSMSNEFDLVLSETLNIPMQKIRVYRSRGFLPFNIFVRFLFCRDKALRMSSRCMFRSWARMWLKRLHIYGIVEMTRSIRYGRDL